YDRTATVNFVQTDIATWGIEDFRKKIRGLYLASVRDEALLSKIGLEDYAPILIKGNASWLQPTLYDLLAHAALSYFIQDRAQGPEPETFASDENILYTEAPVFVRQVFSGADSSSDIYQALGLFQRLLRLHLGDARPDAFVDLDIQRLG